MIKILLKIAAFISLAIVLFMLGFGCSDKIMGTDQDLTVRIPVMDKPTTLNSFILTITAPDIDPPISVPMVMIDGYLVAQVTVPTGEARTFTVEAYEDGRLIYSGSVLADVVAGSRVLDNLNIMMQPVVPAINFTPHLQNGLMGDSFTVGINVYNMPTLQNLSFEVVYNSYPGYIDTIEKGFDVDAIDYYSVYQTYNSTLAQYVYQVYIADGTVSAAMPLTKVNGNAQLANINLYTYYDWSFDTATAVFDVNLLSLGELSGDTIPRDSVFVDNASIFMVAPPFAGK